MLLKDDIFVNFKMNVVLLSYIFIIGFLFNIFVVLVKFFVYGGYGNKKDVGDRKMGILGNDRGFGLSEVGKKEMKEMNLELVVVMEKLEVGIVVEWKEVEVLWVKKWEEVEVL